MRIYRMKPEDYKMKEIQYMDKGIESPKPFIELLTCVSAIPAFIINVLLGFQYGKFVYEDRYADIVMLAIMHITTIILIVMFLKDLIKNWNK